MFGFERVQRDAVVAHQRFHVQPGRIGAFRQRILPLVDLVVQDLQADVRDADIINIGENKRNFCLDPVPVLDDAVEFTADIPAGLLYL